MHFFNTDSTDVLWFLAKLKEATELIEDWCASEIFAVLNDYTAGE